jgi:hypothetical protein
MENSGNNSFTSNETASKSTHFVAVDKTRQEYVTRVFDLLSDIAELGTYGSKQEWLNYFEQTRATNEPILLFTDSIRLGLFIEELPVTFCFVAPEKSNEQEGVGNG